MTLAGFLQRLGLLALLALSACEPDRVPADPSAHPSAPPGVAPGGAPGKGAQGEASDGEPNASPPPSSWFPAPEPWTLYEGRALGGFSDADTVKTAAGTTVAFGPGQTLWIVFQTLGVPAATEVVLSSSRGDYMTGAGWRFERASGAGGALYLVSDPGYFQQFSIVPPAYGVTSMCIVWRASDGLVRYAANGGSLAKGMPFPSPVPPDAASFTSIGSPNGDGSAAAASTRVLAFATWDREATAAECGRNTFTSGDRFVLPEAVRAPAVVDCQPSRDWTGGASFTTRGSSPVTFQVQGAPALVPCDEVRWPTPPWYRDTSTVVPQKDAHGYAFDIRDSYAWVEATTDAPYTAVEAYTTAYDDILALDGAPFGVFVDGAFSSAPDLSPYGAPLLVDAQIGAGAGKTVAFVEGTLLYSDGVLPAEGLQGTFLQAVRLPVTMTDGVTPAHSAMVAPQAVQKKLVLVGDSILAGWDAVPLQEHAITPLLRQDFPTKGIGGVACHCIGTDSIANFHAIDPTFGTTVRRVAALAGGTEENTLWIALGTNDYGGSFIPALTFGAYYAAFLDALHEALPHASIVCQSPIQRIAPSAETANHFGDTLDDYRAQIWIVTSARTEFARYVEGAAGAIVSDANMLPSDGLHLTVAGDAQYKAFIKATLAY